MLSIRIYLRHGYDRATLERAIKNYGKKYPGFGECCSMAFETLSICETVAGISVAQFGPGDSQQWTVKTQ